MIKNALITGSSRGIGEAIALKLARQGINIVITYNHNKETAIKVLNKVKAYGVKVIYLKLDQSSVKNIKKAVAIIKKEFGFVNILVNNAAVAQKKPLEEITEDDWDHIIAVNLRGPFFLCQQIIPMMIKKQWGRIINISSIAALTGGVKQVHYAASKAGLINLTKSLAKLYSSKGITSNAIAPEWVATDMMIKELKLDFNKQDFSFIPVGRAAKPEEIANATAFLCSDESGYITGQTININGGLFFG